MTIYGVQYRPAPYRPTTTWQRLRPLVRLEFAGLFRTRWGMLGAFLCLLPSLVRLMMMLLWVGTISFGGPARAVMPRNMPGLMPDNVRFYVEPVVSMEQFGMLVFLVLTALVTARAIAKDRGTNALELYWTRGISPRGYFLAKWLGSFLLLGTVTVLAPFVVWLIGVSLAGDWAFFVDSLAFLPRALAALAVFTAVLTWICILLSALCGSPSLATILWCVLIGGGEGVANMFASLARREALVASLSVFDAAAALAYAIAGIPQRDGNLGGALTLLVVVSVLLLLLARRRLRLQEAIA